MPAPQETTPAEVRKVVWIQLALTAGFLVVVFGLLGGLDADLPPIWLMAVSIVVIVIGAVLAERAWLKLTPLDPTASTGTALDAFVAHTTRKFVICEGALLICILLAFASNSAGWLVVIAGVPALAVLAFETWPSPRNLSLTAAMLDTNGAESGLLESFETR